MRKRYLEQIPLGRFGQVDDVVNAAMFLCSPLAQYITGQVIVVDGGNTVQEYKGAGGFS